MACWARWRHENRSSGGPSLCWKQSLFHASCACSLKQGKDRGGCPGCGPTCRAVRPRPWRSSRPTPRRRCVRRLRQAKFLPSRRNRRLKRRSGIGSPRPNWWPRPSCFRPAIRSPGSPSHWPRPWPTFVTARDSSKWFERTGSWSRRWPRIGFSSITTRVCRTFSRRRVRRRG